MTTISFQNIRDELVNLLRNSDIFTTSVRGVTTSSQTFTATAGQVAFTLTNTPIKNIRSITVQSVDKYIFRDYTFNSATGVVTLSTGATLNDTVIISYDYGTGDKIYPDMPRVDLTLNSYPRIGVEITSLRTEPLGLGGMNHISDFIITIYAWVPVNKDTNIAGGIGGTHDLNDLMSSIRDKIRTNAKSLYTLSYIHPVGMSPLISGQNSKIIQMSTDFNGRFVVE